MITKASDMIEQEPLLSDEEVPVVRITCICVNGTSRLLKNNEIAQRISTALRDKLFFDAEIGLWTHCHNGRKHTTTRREVTDFIKKILEKNRGGCSYDKARFREIAERLKLINLPTAGIFSVFVEDNFEFEKGSVVKSETLYELYVEFCRKKKKKACGKNLVTRLAKKNGMAHYKVLGRGFYSNVTIKKH